MKKRTTNSTPTAPDGGKSYTIDELTAATGVPSRTIRFYQAKGALPPPVKKGRIAYYNKEHVERLQLVAVLQDRGFNLRAISDLVSQVDENVSVGEWLGLGEQLQASWTEDKPRIFAEDELREILGKPLRPGFLTELEETELIRREGTTRPATYVVGSPGMLQLAMKLEAGGFNVKIGKTAVDIMRKRLAKMVDELSRLFRDFLVREDVELSSLDPKQLGQSVQALRDIWLEATRLILAQEIERATHELVEKGKLLEGRRTIKKKARTRRR